MGVDHDFPDPFSQRLLMHQFEGTIYELIDAEGVRIPSQDEPSHVPVDQQIVQLCLIGLDALAGQVLGAIAIVDADLPRSTPEDQSFLCQLDRPDFEASVDFLHLGVGGTIGLENSHTFIASPGSKQAPVLCLREPIDD